MRIERAETAGFCMGVDLALRKLDREIAQGEDIPIFTLGPIIHNPQVLNFYEEKGVTQVKPENIPPNSIVVLRAHGIPREIEQELRNKGVTVVDATCPKVKKAQLLIAEQSSKSKRLLLYGERDHPEVRGLLSYADENALVFDSLDELKDADLSPEHEYFIAAQTTQDKEYFEKVVDYLNDKLGEMPVLRTICDATKERQAEAVEISKNVDAFVVVGGFSSGNTRRLVHVIKEAGIPCLHVETPDEIPPEYRKYEIIGLTAGASTPKNIIDAVEEKLRQYE